MTEIGPRKTSPHSSILARALSVLFLVAACSSNSVPKALPPVTMAPTPPEAERPVATGTEQSEPEQIPSVPEAGEPAPVVEPIASNAPKPVTTMVIETPEESTEEAPSLFEAAEREKARRAEAGESTIVLDDKTLKEYSKGNLTFLEPDEEGAEEGDGAAPSGAESSEGDSAAEGADGEPADDADDFQERETYWRNRVLDLRIAWRDAFDRIGELEEEIAGLRRDFYAEDDPFYRDSQIKPAWDAAIEELERSRRDAERHRAELDEVLVEGHREGALPGWLREGIELEPTEDELAERHPEEDEFHQPSEPVIVDEDGGGGA